jgi:hypothetical protein
MADDEYGQKPCGDEGRGRRKRSGRQSRHAADAVTAGAAVGEARPETDQQATDDARRRGCMDRGRRGMKKRLRDERRRNQAGEKGCSPDPVARAAAQGRRGSRAEDAALGQDEPRGRETNENAACQGGERGEMGPVDGHGRF